MSFCHRWFAVHQLGGGTEFGEPYVETKAYTEASGGGAQDSFLLMFTSLAPKLLKNISLASESL